MIESNKVVISNYGIFFVGKGYDCGVMFRLFPSDFGNKVVNHISVIGNKTDGVGIYDFVTLILVV